MAKSGLKTTIHYLPNEIMHDIFSRLPVQTLSQCLFVSKIWYSSIQEPDFVKPYHSSRFLITCQTDRFLSKFYLVDLFDTSLRAVQTKFNLGPKRVKIVGSANGLICLRSIPRDGHKDPLRDRHIDLQSFHICNPVTGDVFNLPKSPSDEYLEDNVLCYASQSGFVFDETTNTYKVVHTWSILGKAFSEYVYDKYEPYRTEIGIYTLGSPEGWKVIQELTGSSYFAPRLLGVSCSSSGPEVAPVFLKSVLYMKMICPDTSSSTHCIGAINIERETFTIINTHILGGHFFGLCVLGEHLYFACQETISDDVYLWTSKKDGRWQKTYGIMAEKLGPLKRGSYKITGSNMSGVVLLVGEKHQGYYDLETGQFQEIKINGIPWRSAQGYSDITAFVHNGRLISPRLIAADGGKIQRKNSNWKYATRTFSRNKLCFINEKDMFEQGRESKRRRYR